MRKCPHGRNALVGGDPGLNQDRKIKPSGYEGRLDFRTLFVKQITEPVNDGYGHLGNLSAFND